MARPPTTHRSHQRLGADFSAHDDFRFRRACLRQASRPLLDAHNRVARDGFRLRRLAYPDALSHGPVALSSTAARGATLVANPGNVLGSDSSGQLSIFSLLH